jgi:hypothetical protein
MKLLLILLLTCVLSLGVACSSEPKLSEGEAIALVQGMLRSHPDESCNRASRYDFVASFSEGKWIVKHRGWEIDNRVVDVGHVWHVYEGSNAIQTVKGKC